LRNWKPSSHKWTPDGWIWVRYPPGNLQEDQSRGKRQNYEDRLRKMREEGEVLIQALVKRLGEIKVSPLWRIDTPRAYDGWGRTGYGSSESEDRAEISRST